LSKKQPDGHSLRDHLESAWEQTGEKPDGLETGETPDLLIKVWNWFIELDQGRNYSEMGALPITYQDIKAWAYLMRVFPEPYEIKIIKQIDTLYLTKK